MARASSFLVGVAVGSAVGAALALLYAPQSGKNTRQQIKDTSQRAQGKIGNLSRSVKDSAGRLAERSKGFVGIQQKRIEAAVQAGREAVEEKRSEMETRLKG